MGRILVDACQCLAGAQDRGRVVGAAIVFSGGGEESPEGDEEDVGESWKEDHDTKELEGSYHCWGFGGGGDDVYELLKTRGKGLCETRNAKSN